MDQKELRILYNKYQRKINGRLKRGEQVADWAIDLARDPEEFEKHIKLEAISNNYNLMTAEGRDRTMKEIARRAYTNGTVKGAKSLYNQLQHQITKMEEFAANPENPADARHRAAAELKRLKTLYPELKSKLTDAEIEQKVKYEANFVQPRRTGSALDNPGQLNTIWNSLGTSWQQINGSVMHWDSPKE